MAKYSASKTATSKQAPRSGTVKPGGTVKQGSGKSGFVDRNLCAVNPKTTQFEPTPGAGAVRQHYKMAGGA